MVLLNQKEYPETFNYVGPAQKGYINFWTFKVGLLSDTTVVNAINWAIEKVLYAYGLEPLNITIDRWPSTHMWLPTYDYRVEFVYYEKGLSLGKGVDVKRLEPITAIAVLTLLAKAITVLAVGVAVYIGATGIRSIFYSKGYERSQFIDIAIAAITIVAAVGGSYLFYKKVIKKGGKS